MHIECGLWPPHLPYAVGKQEAQVVPHFSDEGQRLAVVVLGLAAEAGDEVTAETCTCCASVRGITLIVTIIIVIFTTTIIISSSMWSHQTMKSKMAFLYSC